MAFILFVGLAIITFSTDEITVTHVTGHDHFYTPQVFTVNDSDILEINEALANNWILGRHGTDDDNDQGLSITYQASTNKRPDRLNITHSAETESHRLLGSNEVIYYDNNQREWFITKLTTDTAIRKVILDIEVINIDQYIDTRYRDTHTSVSVHDVTYRIEPSTIRGTGYQDVGNGSHTITIPIPAEPVRNEIALRISTSYDIAADMPEQVLYRITGITIEKAPIPESKLEHIRETTTYPILILGELNIAVAFIFIFLALINLLVFINDTLEWKKKTSKPL